MRTEAIKDFARDLGRMRRSLAPISLRYAMLGKVDLARTLELITSREQIAAHALIDRAERRRRAQLEACHLEIAA